MRALLISIGVIAVALILIGLLVKAVKWLLIIGVLALVIAIIAGFIQAKRMT
ncbi:hypothetical protein [Glycomyces arizonensis]|uniref:hypothetical protein n=1 Tax=Glycomyces arizonensis TaxID=256035 RepID=UPI000403AA02|nr:hypothetical protein [Glycomyces arizonensis]